MAQPGAQESDDIADREVQPVAPRTPTVGWVNGALVCVTIVAAPVREPRPASCQCEACCSAQLADCAERLLR